VIPAYAHSHTRTQYGTVHIARVREQNTGGGLMFGWTLQVCPHCGLPSLVADEPRQQRDLGGES